MNIRDSESAYQEGRIMFLEFQREFMRQWYEPLYRAQLAAFMASLSQQDMMLPGMEVVAPVAQQMLGGNNASQPQTPNQQALPVHWTGANRNRSAPTLPDGQANGRTPIDIG